MWRHRVAVAALALLLVAVVAVGAQAAPSVTGVRVGQYADVTRLVVDLTEPVEFSVFSLANPDRVVIDLTAVNWGAGERTQAIGRAGVAQLRFGQFRPDTARLVLDLHRPLAVRQAELLEQHAKAPVTHRLILDLVPVSQAAFRTTVQPSRLAEPATQARRAPSAEPVPLPQLKPAPKRVRHLIAIDPGHGGRDPGAIASNGLREKVLALAFSRELRAELEASGRYRAVMTRDGDHKVGLHRRVEIARAAGADLFLSIHLDRLENRDVHGASVYTLADEASDVETAELAARENKADIVADIDLSEGYDEEVAKVLISMVQQNTMNCSAVLAATLLPELGHVVPLIKRPHRFGDFRVLKAPDIPSVLVELGFLSNDRDAERLQSESHRRILAGAIVKALDTYYREPC
ncbi:MAG: N-acetylmuramoyl-L-alanine amidase [Rhodospirillales bacterium]|nr:N-acetylmuramoyl-L-alanine amidase [Rhodospirillales bacterium]